MTFPAMLWEGTCRLNEQSAAKPNVLCLASYEKGQAFLQQLDAEGCNVILLTAQKLRDAAWPWDAIGEVHTFSDIPTSEEV